MFIGWNCLITLMINQHSGNQRWKDESTQLLNWMPSAVILQSSDQAKKSIIFANRSSKTLLKRISSVDEEMTWQDTLKKVFRKVHLTLTTDLVP